MTGSEKPPMRILFSGSPVGGHLLPLLPMAHAAREQGHQVAVLSSASMAELVAPLPILAAGPGIPDVVAETQRRIGRSWNGPGPEAAQMFADVRVDLSYDEAFEQAGRFRPDLIVCETFDFVGPTLAAALEVPWAGLAISGGLPPQIVEPLDSFGADQLSRRGLSRTQRQCLFDPYPDVLHGPGVPQPPDRRPIQPVPLPSARRAPVDVEQFRTPGAPVLLSLGTSGGDPQLPARIAEELVAAGLNVLATHSRPDQHAVQSEQGEPTRSGRVRWLGFTPLGEVLDQVAAVVSLGGTGTVLTALWAGVPLALQPMLADQPLNAARVAALGAGRVADDTSDDTSDDRSGDTPDDTGSIGAVAADVASGATYHERARTASASIRSLLTPGEALAALIDELS